MGSSPLTRGKRSKVGFRVAFVGLIPAHAGKTYKFSLHPCYTRAHPRSRGENAGQTMPLPLSTGSSPLTRGKPDGNVSLMLATGLIPAHAGKT